MSAPKPAIQVLHSDHVQRLMNLPLQSERWQPIVQESPLNKRTVIFNHAQVINNRIFHKNETHLLQYSYLVVVIFMTMYVFLFEIDVSGPKCVTTNDSPTKDTPCAIPFKFQGKLKEGCITETDPDGRHWCSTKVDEKLDHVPGEGNWGYCTDSCPLSGIVFNVDM